MEGFKAALFIGLLFLCAITFTRSAINVSVKCMESYDEGGARAVFKSSYCPQWVLPINSSSLNHLEKCHFATLQGARDYQEDRLACNPALIIPILGQEGKKDVKVSVAAVFDGHGGTEASELASKKFLEYFSLNAVFINYKKAFKNKENAVESSLYEVLEEALLRTFKDIDSEFSQKAWNRGYDSGSTGTVVLLVTGKVLVGYVGDSKAVLCSDAIHDAEGNLVISSAEELTKDHHPDREDEKARIEAAGGYVQEIYGVHRVNGMLAISRAIGDVMLKSKGVIAEPEIIGWRDLLSYNRYLVVASDGVYERDLTTPKDVCDILQKSCSREASETGSGSPLSTCSSSSALAKSVARKAFRKGSTDNISIILIPLLNALQDS